MITVRRLLMSAVLAVAPTCASYAQQTPAASPAATGFPDRPITALVGFAPGGTSDTTMRKLADSARQILGQPIVVDNKPGAAGSTAISLLSKRAPDGYTIGPLLVGALINQHIRKVDYKTEELSPIVMFGTLPQGIVVQASSRWKNMGEFVAYAKSKPGAIRYSTAGVGTAQHLAMERLGSLLGIEWVHVPYKGGQDAVRAVVAGEVDASAQTPEWAPFVRNGKLRLLATFTEKRIAEFPDAPTMRDLGYEIVAPSFIGIVGPKGMDAAIVRRLHDAFRPSLEDPQFGAILQTMAIVPEYRGPEDFGRLLRSANAFYADVVSKTPGLTLN